MTTDAWQQVRAAVVDWWHQVHPRHETIATELDGLRAQIVAARERGGAGVEQDLIGVWQGRIQQVLLENPASAEVLRRLLEQTLIPAVPGTGSGSHLVVMTGEAHDTSSFTQVAGSQINYR